MFLDVLKLCYIRAERLFFLIQSLETRGRNVCDSNEWEKKHIETTWPLPRHGRLALVFSCILYILNILYASLCPRRTLFRLKHKNNKKITSNSFLFVVRIFFIGSANNFSTDTLLSLIKIKTKGHNLHKFDLC